VLEVRRWTELMADRKKMEGHCSTGQSPQWALVPMEEEEGKKKMKLMIIKFSSFTSYLLPCRPTLPL